MFKGLFRKSSGSTPPSSPPTSPSTPSPDSKRGKLENVSPSSVSSSPRESFLNTSLDASEDRTPTSPFNYNANGEAIDPIIEHLSSSDTYLTCGQFIKVKREFAEAIQSKETVLVFCKEAVYNIRMPTYLQRQFRPFSPSDEDCVDSPKGFGTGGAYDENYRQRRRRNSGIPNAPILRGSGNLRISASPTAGYTGVTARRRPKIGWRVHYSFLHSIEPSLRFGSMFTLHFYNFQKSKTSDGLVSKTYECENRAERDEWLVVLRGILQEFQQLFFEKLIVPHPEVYQYHVWLQKPSSKKRNHRCLILSTDQLYLVDLLPGEDSLRGISEKIVVPIEAIELKFLCNTPGAFILEFDRKVLANVKMRPIEKQKLHCRDGLELIEVIKSIVDLYHRRTRRVPPLQKVNNEEQI